MITKSNAQSLFQAIVLMTIAVYMFTVISVFLIFGLRYTILVSIIAIIISYSLYRWSFTPDYKRAIHGFIVISFVLQFVFMFITPTIETTELLLIPIFFVHLFYDSRTMLLMIVASLILVNVFTLTYVNNINPFPIIDLFTRNIFTIAVIGMLFVSTSTRNRNEREILEKTIALEESESQLWRVIQNSVLGTALFDVREGRITDLSNNKLPGYDYETIAEWLEIILPEDRKAIHESYYRLIRNTGNPVEHLEFRMQKPNGRLEIAECHLSVFKTGPTGQPETVLVSIHFVTEQRLAEQNRLALAVQQQKVELMNDVVLAFSHEFRTPLSSIELSLHLLERHLAAPQTVNYIERARSQIARLNRLLTQLTFVMRLEQNITLHQEVINITSLVKQMVAVAQSSIASTDLQLTLSDANEDVNILGDSDFLASVFQQVLDNAIKYTPTDGQISVVIERSDEDVTISIKDNGTGIDEHEQPKLFERFIRADAHRHEEGLGLGLYIVKKIVEAHAGTVTLHSTKGQGTEVRLTFPIPQGNHD